MGWSLGDGWTWAFIGSVVVLIFVGDAINRWWQLNAWKRRWNRRPRPD